MKEEFGHELEAVRNDGEHRENGTWRIDAPVFNRKDRQRTYWITTIAVDAKLFKYQRPTVPTSSEPRLLSDLGRAAPEIDYQRLTVPASSSPWKLSDLGRVAPEIDWSEALAGNVQRPENRILGLEGPSSKCTGA